MTAFARALVTTAALAMTVGLEAPRAEAQQHPRIAQAQNPCAATNPCAAQAKLDPTLITRPAGSKLTTGDSAELLTLGERLWSDPRVGTGGLSCQTCHQGNASFNTGFAQPYPHPVAMAQQRAGLPEVDAAEMVQLCLVVPMASQPLPWDSKELAALTAYVRDVQKRFEPSAAAVNPWSPQNPCAAQNPCAPMNPCAPQNPCAAKQ